MVSLLKKYGQKQAIGKPLMAIGSKK